jgi:hypothetical protein
MNDEHAPSPGDEAAARGVDQPIEPDAPTSETVSDETNAPVEIPDAEPGAGLLDDPGPGGDIYTAPVENAEAPTSGPEAYAEAVGAEPDADEDAPQPERRPELRDI